MIIGDPPFLLRKINICGWRTSSCANFPTANGGAPVHDSHGEFLFICEK